LGRDYEGAGCAAALDPIRVIVTTTTTALIRENIQPPKRSPRQGLILVGRIARLGIRARGIRCAIGEKFILKI
jgi:hypothetical protein